MTKPSRQRWLDKRDAIERRREVRQSALDLVDALDRFRSAYAAPELEDGADIRRLLDDTRTLAKRVAAEHVPERPPNANR